MSEIRKYFHVKHSDYYFPFSMSSLDEFTNDDIKRIMGFTGEEELEEIDFYYYALFNRNVGEFNSPYGLGKPKNVIHHHRTTDECKANRVAKRRKKNKNKKTHRI